MKWIAWICPALLIAWTAEGQERLAIVGATIIDGNGGAPIVNGTILIDGDRITAVGSRSDTAVPSDSRVIDGSGKFVTPDFIDTNVHLSLYGGHSPERYETLVRYHNRQEDVVLEASQLHLKVGVTTVRDSYGVLPPLINVRDKIARGDEVGARMLVAGNIVGWGGPFSMSFSLIRETGLTVFQEQMNDLVAQGAGRKSSWTMTPSELRSAINAYLDKGVDFIKFGGHRAFLDAHLHRLLAGSADGDGGRGSQAREDRRDPLDEHRGPSSFHRSRRRSRAASRDEGNRRAFREPRRLVLDARQHHDRPRLEEASRRSRRRATKAGGESGCTDGTSRES